MPRSWWPCEVARPGKEAGNVPCPHPGRNLGLSFWARGVVTLGDTVLSPAAFRGNRRRCPSFPFPVSPSSRRPSLSLSPPPDPGDSSGVSTAPPNPHEGHKGGTILQHQGLLEGSEHPHSHHHHQPPAGHSWGHPRRVTGHPECPPATSGGAAAPSGRHGFAAGGDSRPRTHTHTRVSTHTAGTHPPTCVPRVPSSPPGSARRDGGRPRGDFISAEAVPAAVTGVCLHGR